MRRRGSAAAAGLFTALAACAGSEEVTRRPAFAPTAGIFQEPLPVVTTTDDDLLASVSPIGDRIVYVARTGGNLDLFRRDLAGGAAQRLTTHSTDDSDPAFSPDGKQIAWVSQEEDVKGDIWVMRADGAGRRRLTDRNGAERAPAWSPDGRQLFFNTRPAGSLSERVDALELASGERRTVVESGWDAAVSSDGKALFYVALDDQKRPRLYARDLADGRTAALTDGAYAEALPRATSVESRTVVIFTRFVDDMTNDGVADADDPSSLWALTYDPLVLQGAPPPAARPLTASEDSEIFAAPFGDWLLYTTSGFADLDIYALPISGMVNAAAGAEAVLAAARAEESPALRRLALRHIVASAPALEGSARYELARELAERDRPNDAIAELKRVVERADNPELAALAEMESERLRMLQRLRGRLLARDDADRAYVQKRARDVQEIAAHHGGSPRVQLRARSIEAEAAFALGRRAAAVALFERIARDAAVSEEDGARALDRLGEIYADMGDRDAVERVTVALLRGFGGERAVARRATDRLVAMAREAKALPPLLALERLARDYADLPILAARAAAAQAETQAATGAEAVAAEQWRWIADHFAGERAVQSRALTALAELAGRLGQLELALDAYERVLAEFPDDPKLRSRARHGITRIALEEAGRGEELARRESDAVARQKRLEGARSTYERLLRNNPDVASAHRRYIDLSARLGMIDSVAASYRARAAASPRDKNLRYGHGYALTYRAPLDLERAEAEVAAALELDPRFAAAHLTLGWIRMQRERHAPAQGWLEKAVDSLDAAAELTQPRAGDPSREPELWAAAQLNLGNAMFALGKTDTALAAYQARDASGVPFDDPLTESLFRESFARVALAEEQHKVALRMAQLALEGTTRRKAAVSGLLAAIYLSTGSYSEAAEWYETARARYAEANDSARVVPMLRGRALAEQALGRHDEALATFAEIIAVVKAGGGPGTPQAPGIVGLVTEIASNVQNVTRAKYGFSGLQEEELARAAAARILRDFGDGRLALDFAKRRLELLRDEAGDVVQGERIRLELLHALHEAAIAATVAGESAQAVALWREALPLVTRLGRWADGAVLLESMMQLALRQPNVWELAASREAIALATAGIEATSKSEPAVARRLTRWLSLAGLREVVAPAPPIKLDEERFTALIGDLDRRVEASKRAQELAEQSGDTALLRHLTAYRGEEVPAPESTGSDWRALYDRALWDHEPAQALSATHLEAALVAWESAPAPTDAPERRAFVAAALELLLRRGQTERAWRLLERDRLLDLQPQPRRAGKGEVAESWAALRQLRGEPDKHRKTLAGAATLVRALEGEPVDVAAVRAALEGAGCLVQLFAPEPTAWHWFVIDGTSLEHHVTDAAPVELPAFLGKRDGAALPLYVDLGELSTPAALGLTGEVSEVLSATYLVAAWQRRNVWQAGAVSVRGAHDEYGGLRVDVRPDEYAGALEAALRIGAKRLAVRVALPQRAEALALGRSGLAQVVFGDAATATGGERLDLDRLTAAGPLDAGFFFFDSLPQSNRARRAVAQALLIAGVPTLLVGGTDPEALWQRVSHGPLDERFTQTGRAARAAVLGYGRMDLDTRVSFAALEYKRLELGGAAAYKRAFGSRNPRDWRAAQTAFEDAVLILETLRDPLLRSRMEKLGGESEKLAAGLEARIGRLRPILAQIYSGLGDFESAAAMQKLVIDQLDATAKAAEKAKMHLELGKTRANARQAEQASVAFESCARLASEAGDRLLASDCLSRLGSMRRALFDNAGAIRAYQESIMGYAAVEALQQLYPRRYLGFLYESVVNDYTKALEQYQAALSVAERHKAADQLPALRLDIARIHRSRGDYEAALAEIDMARQAAKSGTPAQRSAVELEAARIYWYRGNYRRALSHQKQSLELAEEAKRALSVELADETKRSALVELAQEGEYLEIQARSLAGLIALNQGELTAAERNITDALALARRATPRRRSEEAAQLNNLGLILEESGRPAEALEHYKQALEIDESLGSIEGRAYDMRAIGVALHRLGDDAAALTQIQKALELSRSIGNSYNELRCLYHLGEIQQASGNTESAATFNAAARLARQISVPELEWRSFYAIGRLTEAAGDAAAARRHFDQALAVAERLGRSTSQGSREHGRDALYGDVIRLALAAGDTPAAFDYIERARARSLLDILATAPLELPDAHAKTLLNRELNLRDARAAAEREASLGGPGAAAKVRAAQHQHEEAAAELRSAYPRLYRALTIAPVSLAELQRLLPEGTRVLTSFVGTRQTILLEVASKEVRAHSLDLGSADLDEAVRALRVKMRGFAPVEADLAALSAKILVPLNLSGTRVLVIVPHGALHHVPFAALPLPGKPNEPLLAATALARVPSASFLADDLRRPAAPRPSGTIAFAPADDLPFARLEALDIGGATAVLGADATEGRLRAARGGALDIAAHGVLDAADPLASAIKLASGPDDDGRLELREVFGLGELPPLVTLSACDSAGGDVSGAEWLGLGSAFLTAGARTVVASTNRISDLAAAVTMKRFHRLARTQPSAEALRVAALSTRRYFAHPAHWSSFVLLGDFR